MKKGIYVLIINLRDAETISVGKIGKIFFRAGYYAYVGSAFNGLESRLARHLSSEKKLHWHIDYLLQKAEVGMIYYSITRRNKECVVAAQLACMLDSVPKFGSSDCRCKSHLYFSSSYCTLSKTIRESFKENGLFFGCWCLQGADSFFHNKDKRGITSLDYV